MQFSIFKKLFWHFLSDDEWQLQEHYIEISFSNNFPPTWISSKEITKQYVHMYLKS